MRVNTAPFISISRSGDWSSWSEDSNHMWSSQFPLPRSHDCSSSPARYYTGIQALRQVRPPRQGLPAGISIFSFSDLTRKPFILTFDFRKCSSRLVRILEPPELHSSERFQCELGSPISNRQFLISTSNLSSVSSVFWSRAWRRCSISPYPTYSFYLSKPCRGRQERPSIKTCVCAALNRVASNLHIYSLKRIVIEASSKVLQNVIGSITGILS
jgi:hypothetical protein